MEAILREIERSKALREFLRNRIPVEDGPGCVCCKLIFEDLDKNERLTGYPSDHLGSPTFPVEGKVLHLAAELKVERMIDGTRVRVVRDLLPFIHDKVEELESEGEKHVEDEW